jgi:hypothetical protein
MPTTITTLFVVTAVVPISSGFISDNNVINIKENLEKAILFKI